MQMRLPHFLNSLPFFWLVLTVPALIMLWDFAGDPALAFDLIHPSGEMSVRLMIAAMVISPLQAIFGRRSWLGWLQLRRRAIGVAACSYGLLHLGFYLIDMAVWDQIVKDAQIASIWTGYAAMLIFLAMGLTSNTASQKLLKRNWKRLQRLVYPAAVFVALHWMWVDGDVSAALLYLAPLAGLEFVRLIVLIQRRLRLPSRADAC